MLPVMVCAADKRKRRAIGKELHMQDFVKAIV